MRARLLLLGLLALSAPGCDSGKPAIAHPESLNRLEHLTRERNDFGVILDARTGKALSAFRVNNPIRAAVPDGEGGWYIGGGFIHVDGQLRKRLAHIRSDGTLDPDWRPEANGNGVSVTSLARIGSRLYVAGDFARMNRRPRVHIAALAADTSALASWQPPPSGVPGGPVLLGVGNRLLVGGYAGSPTASGLVALDAETGRLVHDWHAYVDTSNIEGGGVRVLARVRGRLYLAGMFSSVDGVDKPGLAAVDARTGRLDRGWRPPLDSRACGGCSDVTALASGRDVLYAALPGQLAALDARTGAFDRRWRTTLDLTTGLNGGSSAYALVRFRSLVYVAGYFDGVNGRARRGFAAVDFRTAKPLPVWNPRGNTVSARVLTLSRSRLLVGVELSRQVVFDFSGLKTFNPVRRLKLVLALSGPGSVRVGIGRRCGYEGWLETGRCSGRVLRWLGSVRFREAQRRGYDHDLAAFRRGHYFVRFVPRARNGLLQAPSDFWFRVA